MDILKKAEVLEFAKSLSQIAEIDDHTFQYCIGHCYYHGYRIEQNYEYAVALFKLSAEQENPVALSYLAICYEKGQGIKQDYKKAIKLYKSSAKQNYWLAFWNLGKMYHYEKGVDKNLEKAKEYYEKALENSDKIDDYRKWAFKADWECLPVEKRGKEYFQEEIDKIDAELAELSPKQQS
jgi:FOG: TPR repeat, SEL1 subfamily